jgi:hypothetical protein
MNKYGRIAKKHWSEFRPLALAELPESEREEFFSTLGEQMEARIINLTIQLEGSDTPGEGYLEKVGRLNAAKMQAEEIVLAESVYSTVEDDEEDGTDPKTFAWINEVAEARRIAMQEEPETFFLP